MNGRTYMFQDISADKMALKIICLLLYMVVHAEAQSDCSVLATNKGYPVASVCNQNQLAQPIFVMDFYGAQSISEKSCECTLTSSESYTLTVRQFSSVGVNYQTSNHCGVKVFFTTSNSGSDSIHCSPTLDLNVKANDPMTMKLVKELSVYDARFCMEMRSSKPLNVNCQTPSTDMQTTPTVAPSTTSYKTTTETTKKDQTTAGDTTQEQTKQAQTTAGATTQVQTTKQDQTTAGATTPAQTKQAQMTTDFTPTTGVQTIAQTDTKPSTQGQTAIPATTMQKTTAYLDETTATEQTSPLVPESTFLTSEMPVSTEDMSSTIKDALQTSTGAMSTDMQMSSMSPTSGDTPTSLPFASSTPAVTIITTTEREEAKDDRLDNLTYIIPAVVGGAVLLLLVVGVLQCACRSRDKEQKKTRFTPSSYSSERFFKANLTENEMTENSQEEYEQETMYNPVFIDDSERGTILQSLPDGTEEKITRFSSHSSEHSEDSSHPNSESYLYATVNKHKDQNGIDVNDEHILVDNNADNDEMHAVQF